MDAPYAACSKYPTYVSAKAFMLNALAAVRDRLPSAALAGVTGARRLVPGAPGVMSDEEALRVSLWKSIEGRDQEQTPEILSVRATICVLYASVAEPPDASGTLEFFLLAFRTAGLPEEALATAYATTDAVA